ncbi:MAG: BREX-1 system adenine-specific DNA-methyltransferase PglX [Opitutaceae bacterium]|nr:BREX-1 system adenine-specific DNA-methyltransferase PglX [Cytophagales bacterium]
MKLSDHTEHIRKLIDSAFRNRLGRMGITVNKYTAIEDVLKEHREDRERVETIREVFIEETGSIAEAYEKLVEEFTFTLFNRLAALKVMEAHTLHPEIVTRRSQHGDRSFAHKHWLEQNPDGRSEEMEGLVRFVEDQLASLATDIPLFSPQHPYHLLPTAIELSGIMNAFNQVETDTQVDDDIWQSDDVLGWLYESYNNYKKAAHKESGDKTEFNKVSIQSQVYTPRWVVKFLVDNSLGKLYLEMYPDSDIKNRYKIANAPKMRTREPKPLTEIRMIDPATGSGNYLLYGFDLFYDLYTDQIENYGADYDDRKIAELIIANNLHGVDLDDRAIQLAQLGLYIKAKRKKRSAKIDHFNIVSSDFYLPEYDAVKHLFESEQPLSPELEKIVTDLWADLQQAYKFGALLLLEEKFSMRLHGLVDREAKGLTLFSESTLANYENFRDNFFTNLQKAVVQNTAKQGQTFLNTKTLDAITFLQLLTQKYDVAVANPPYTDSADFGPELKTFLDANYRQPYKFNSNLYASFIKRCCELVDEKGKVALVHPQTFMYIKTFEDVRKYLLDKMHISLFVEWGYLGMFNPTARVDASMYVLEKEKSETPIQFIKLNDLYEGKRYEALFQTYDDLLANKPNNYSISLNQEKLKIIKGWPFIYWISDGFRKKFEEKGLDEFVEVAPGLQIGGNEIFLRFWWEIDNNEILNEKDKIKKKWVSYAKGGPFNKWYGNIWLVINWRNDGEDLKKKKERDLQEGRITANNAKIWKESFYFNVGITYSPSGSKGPSFRLLPNNHIFDIGGASIFPKIDFYNNLNYLLAFLNSNLTFYLLECFNPTVNIQSSDLKRVPFVKPPILIEDNISVLAEENVAIKKKLNSFRLIEKNFERSPVFFNSDVALKNRLLTYLNFENAQTVQVLLNEGIINQLIFKVYDLSIEDRMQVEAKMGKSVAELPILEIAYKAYLSENTLEQEIVKTHIASLEVTEFDIQKVQSIKSDFGSLYQSNNDLEEFCIRHQVNPINVWYWFKESKVLPQARAAEIALEFLADAFRTILMEDEDGIVPLVGLPGEPRLMDRFEEYCFSRGFTSAQIMQLDALVGRPINEYVEHYFFKNFSDHLNLFMYLPKTPFIWHLSSGEHQGFEVYIIIYKWNRDSLYKLKSSYLSKRTESLQYRLQQIADSTSGLAQTEKETIRLQLQEIETFAKKIDALIAEGYDPKLDDGVGKNIAPLQAKGMLKAEVLKTTGGTKSQLQKYLNADW